MIVVMLYVFIRKRVIEISTEFFVIKLNSKMCAFSALYEGIGSKQTVQYLHRKKNQDFDQCVRCKYCTVAGGGDMVRTIIFTTQTSTFKNQRSTSRSVIAGIVNLSRISQQFSLC